MKEIDIIEQYCAEHQEVFCYGAGLYGRTVAAYLAGRGKKIEGFIVTDLSNDMSVQGHKVYSIDGYLDIHKEEMGIIITVGEKYRDEISDILKNGGIDDYIYVSDEVIPYMQENGNFENKYKSDNNISVLCYHRVADVPLDTWKINVRKELFEQHLRYYKENYTVLRSENEWNLKNNSRGVVLTFDDGYEDAYTNILPLLEKYEIPATFFICVGNLNTDKEFWWDELERIIFYANKNKKNIEAFGENIPIRSYEEKEKACYRIHPILKSMDYKERDKWLIDARFQLGCEKKRSSCHSLSYNQLKELAKSEFVTIGGHTITHSCLANESYEKQKWEIEESKKEIENIIGKEIEVFSYPFGQRDDFTEETVEIAKSVGYKRIFTAYAGVAREGSRNGYIPRINIGKENNFDSGMRKLLLYENIYGDDMV